MPEDRRMNALRRNAVFVLAWILFWLLMILVAVQEFLRNEGSDALWKPLLWEGSSAFVATLFALAQLHWSPRDDALLGTPRRWFGRQARWLPLYWIAFVPLAFGIRHAVYALVGETYHHDTLPHLFLYESMKISIFFGLFTAVRFGVQSYRALLVERLRAERSQALLRQAQLQRLGQQMQPHFLFNALNTVSSLIWTDPARADATLLQLADVLRETLAVGDEPCAPLAAELRLARGYAGVMAERFADRVAIGWQVDDTLLDRAVPVMSLQPLIENVFKHTVARRRAPTRIDVCVARDGDALVLRVDDDAGELTATPAPSNGIGLANLRARIEALYGTAARLDVVPRPDGGVRAELRLPLAGVPCAS
jgi:LytS/YehU family sensor histidine kinase